MIKPPVTVKTLPSGSTLIRFADMQDAYYYDCYDNNPEGLGMREYGSKYRESYIKARGRLSSEKERIIKDAQKFIETDKEFLELVYKGKSDKRKYVKNKFCGNFSPVDYARGDEKIFNKLQPGAKKQALNLAFQVGTFEGGNYQRSFTNILKTIMMCQALNISVNIDMFDSDTKAINNRHGYVIINVAKSSEKLNFRKILACSHEGFFRITLFNGYSASEKQYRIGTFLDQSEILTDLGPYYDVIGGNMLMTESDPMISKIIKIGLGTN